MGGITIEVKDARIANLVRIAVEEKANSVKSLLQTEVSGAAIPSSMDMSSITEMVTDINSLEEVCNQIAVKMQFGTAE